MIKRLPSNSKLKAQKLLANRMLLFQLSQPLAPYVYTVMVQLPPAMERLSLIEQDKILSNKNSSPQIVSVENGSITLYQEILKLRAGANMSPLTKVLLRIVLIWIMQDSAATTEKFTSPGFGHSSKAGPTPRIAPKL